MRRLRNINVVIRFCVIFRKIEVISKVISWPFYLFLLTFRNINIVNVSISLDYFRWRVDVSEVHPICFRWAINNIIPWCHSLSVQVSGFNNRSWFVFKNIIIACRTIYWLIVNFSINGRTHYISINLRRGNDNRWPKYIMAAYIRIKLGINKCARRSIERLCIDRSCIVGSVVYNSAIGFFLAI